MKVKPNLAIALIVLALLWLVSASACAPVMAWAG